VLTTAATPTQAEGKLRKNSAPAPEENEEKKIKEKLKKKKKIGTASIFLLPQSVIDDN
jgi:hypothetical protein